MKEDLSEIPKVIHLAIEMITASLQSFGGSEVNIISGMYRKEPNEFYKAGQLGLDIELDGVKVFLGCESMAEEMVYNQMGKFIVDDFVHHTIKDAFREIQEKISDKEISTAIDKDIIKQCFDLGTKQTDNLLRIEEPSEYVSPKTQNVGEEFIVWAEKYWHIDKVITKGLNDEHGETCPYSYIRNIFIEKINELSKN